MILQIIAPLVASIGTAATLKQDLYVSPMAPSFSMACCRCNLSPGRNWISIAFGNDGELVSTLGSLLHHSTAARLAAADCCPPSACASADNKKLPPLPANEELLLSSSLT
jgi:hypothetical protein